MPEAVEEVWSRERDAGFAQAENGKKEAQELKNHDFPLVVMEAQVHLITNSKHFHANLAQ